MLEVVVAADFLDIAHQQALAVMVVAVMEAMSQILVDLLQQQTPAAAVAVAAVAAVVIILEAVVLVL